MSLAFLLAPCWITVTGLFKDLTVASVCLFGGGGGKKQLNENSLFVEREGK